mmetsp:Transcript_17247/g.33856  ORF Transcript_17247/g.33856 Transcript_17247/m.33856 type:complete len:286 (-) Transcript_17247:2064-2921(-)
MFRVFAKKSFNKINVVRRRLGKYWVPGEVEVQMDCVVNNLILGLAIKRKTTATNKVDDHSNIPNVRSLAIPLRSEDFRSHIRKCTTSKLHDAEWGHQLAEAKITDLECCGSDGIIFVAGAKNVFWFNVAVCNAKHVKIAHSFCKLEENRVNLVFLQPCAAHNSVKKLSSLDELHDQVDVVQRLEGIVQLDNVGVVYELENSDFCAQEFLFFFVQRSFINNFHCAVLLLFFGLAIVDTNTFALVHDRKFTASNTFQLVIPCREWHNITGLFDSSHPSVTLSGRLGI